MTTRRLPPSSPPTRQASRSMMERDEEGTLAPIQVLRRELVEPAIQVHQGRLVNAIQ